MVVTTMNHITKLVTLIEDNPLVTNFSDVDKILNYLYGKNLVSVVSSEVRSPKFQFIDCDRGTDLNRDILCAKTYKIELESEILRIVVEFLGYSDSSKYLVTLLLDEGSNTYITVGL